MSRAGKKLFEERLLAGRSGAGDVCHQRIIEDGDFAAVDVVERFITGAANSGLVNLNGVDDAAIAVFGIDFRLESDRDPKPLGKTSSVFIQRGFGDGGQLFGVCLWPRQDGVGLDGLFV